MLSRRGLVRLKLHRNLGCFIQRYKELYSSFDRPNITAVLRQCCELYYEKSMLVPLTNAGKQKSSMIYDTRSLHRPNITAFLQ